MRPALVPILLADPMPWALKAPYAWDFLRDRARFAGGYRGALANTPNWTFTRASTGYAQTSAGALTAFASGELRRTDKGVLIEGARTNLCLQSQTFDHASWTKGNCTVTANAIAAPDGTLSADKIVSGAGVAFNVNQSVSVTTGVSYAYSVYLKADGRTAVRLQVNNSTGTAIADVDLSNGTISAAAGTLAVKSSAVEAVGGGWYRARLTYTAEFTASTPHFLLDSVNGDGVVGILVWGAQLEAAAFPSSYIPTTTASATRAADVLTVPVSGIDYPISLFLEFEPAVLATVNARLFTVATAANTNSARLSLSSGNLVRGQVDSVAGGGAQMDDTITGAVAAGTTYKIALRAAANNSRQVKNATLGALDSTVTVPATPTTIIFGNDWAANEGFSYLRRAALWTRALTDAELQSLTT